MSRAGNRVCTKAAATAAETQSGKLPLPNTCKAAKAVSDSDQEVAYETCVLSALRPGYRVFHLRSPLGTRLEACVLFVRISCGVEANTWVSGKDIQAELEKSKARIKRLEEQVKTQFARKLSLMHKAQKISDAAAAVSNPKARTPLPAAPAQPPVSRENTLERARAAKLRQQLLEGSASSKVLTPAPAAAPPQRRRASIKAAGKAVLASKRMGGKFGASQRGRFIRRFVLDEPDLKQRALSFIRKHAQPKGKANMKAADFW